MRVHACGARRRVCWASRHHRGRREMEEKRRGSRCGQSSSRIAAPKVPPLPKLHSRGPLVTTELSKPVNTIIRSPHRSLDISLSPQIFKSTVGYDLDLSRPIEDEPFREYNPLHDPHTLAFFHRPSMCLKLQRSGFVTDDLQVVCTLKEYNAYREFMESESMKMRKKQEEKREREKQVEMQLLALCLHPLATVETPIRDRVKYRGPLYQCPLFGGSTVTVLVLLSYLCCTCRSQGTGRSCGGGKGCK